MGFNLAFKGLIIQFRENGTKAVEVRENKKQLSVVNSVRAVTNMSTNSVSRLKFNTKSRQA